MNISITYMNINNIILILINLFDINNIIIKITKLLYIDINNKYSNKF